MSITVSDILVETREGMGNGDSRFIYSTLTLHMWTWSCSVSWKWPDAVRQLVSPEGDLMSSFRGQGSAPLLPTAPSMFAFPNTP